MPRDAPVISATAPDNSLISKPATPAPSRTANRLTVWRSRR
jgi:hypothetical protein